MAASLKDKEASLNSLKPLSFLIGEWRGIGVFRFLTSKRPDVNYEVRYMCKESPDRNQLMIVEFDDDPKKEGMFHASQGFLYVDPKSNKLRFRRTTLMESERQGIVHEEGWEVGEDGQTIKTNTMEKDAKTGYAREVTIQRVGNSKLVEDGHVTEGKEEYEYHETLQRRTRPSH